jgi:hypothetical protein
MTSKVVKLSLCNDSKFFFGRRNTGQCCWYDAMSQYILCYIKFHSWHQCCSLVSPFPSWNGHYIKLWWHSVTRYLTTCIIHLFILLLFLIKSLLCQTILCMRFSHPLGISTIHREKGVQLCRIFMDIFNSLKMCSFGCKIWWVQGTFMHWYFLKLWNGEWKSVCAPVHCLANRNSPALVFLSESCLVILFKVQCIIVNSLSNLAVHIQTRFLWCQTKLSPWF